MRCTYFDRAMVLYVGFAALPILLVEMKSLGKLLRTIILLLLPIWIFTVGMCLVFLFPAYCIILILAAAADAIVDIWTV